MTASAKPIVLTMAGHYLPGFKAGGIVACVANIVNHLHGEFEFLVVTRDRDLGDTEPYADIKPHTWQKAGNAQVCYLSPGGDSVSQLRKIVQQTRPDLIYLNGFFDSLTRKVLLNSRLGLIGATPILLCPHGEFAWPSLRQKYSKKVLFMRMARMFGLYAPAMWHASSRDEAEAIVSFMKVSLRAVHVALQLPPVIEDGKGDDSSFVPPGRAYGIRVVFLSRISREKNLDFALKVLARVRAQVSFDIIGPIENAAYWQECQELLRQLPPHVQAQSLGPIRPTEVINVLRQYDLLLFPSGAESYGQVIAESLISGTQVLISNTTPWRNLEAKGLGWDLPLDDIDAFVRVVDSVASAAEGARRQRRAVVKESIKRYFADSPAVANIRLLFRKALLRDEASGVGLDA
jgi:glycosyltransferase involved in cell wall biosynthesis